MARKLRLFIPYATYHVYCRVARGEFVFADPADANLFLETLCDVRDRDGLSILAWGLHDEPPPPGDQDGFRTALAYDGSAAANRRQKAQPQEAVPRAALAEQVSRAICVVTEVHLDDLCSRKRRSEIASVRMDLTAIAVGRYGHRICDLAELLKKNAGSVSRWLAEADRRQAFDSEYRAHLDHLERRMIEVTNQNIIM